MSAHGAQRPDNLRNKLKGHSGLRRLWNACRYSWDGIVAAWRDEQAFRQIAWCCLAGLPLACWLGRTWGDRVLLGLVLMVALLVELLNSAIENVVDRISPAWHPLSKKAKDMGSAAQCIAQICILVVWGTYLIGRFF